MTEPPPSTGCKWGGNRKNIKKLKLLAVPVFEIFSIFRPYFRDGYYILFIFLFYDYRVSLDPVGQPFCLRRP
ncbi:hypothetical protein AVDCRST_MAG84-1073 [uncultured Microcoleus sp.]|uniref:Uncharacterized protein n=1 Tax=uncultured Microcoleus sp. TaxID=259945 RepID=A0A6J4L0L9_9CYAN|nr:hypothetical protein AVDCRST_MAG84-1073 [uncultured Microcoleus sp.]